jgi:diguanylate cyclase (GGDEF)-like protein/PAS domain S-box-containing protein
LDVNSGELFVNDRWMQLLGYEPDELGAVSFEMWERLSHPTDLKNAKAKLSKVLDHKEKLYDCVVRMRHKDSSWRYIHTRGTLLEHNESRWIVGVHIDVTSEREMKYQLARLTESLPGVIYTFVLKPDGSYYFPYMSAKTRDFYGIAPEVAMRDPDYVFSVIHPEDIGRVKESIAESGEFLSEWNCDYRVQVDGETFWLRGVSLPEREEDGTLIWHGMISNINAQKELEAELERLAITDELTNAFNRRHMLTQLEAYLAEHVRYGVPFSLVSIDIDHFKSVNDNYGHLLGDKVLVGFAQIVMGRIRKTDFFARVGGEEFLLLMPHTELSDAAKFAEDIRVSVEKHQFKTAEGYRFNVTISAGVVECSSQTISVVEEILRVCDRLLYHAKNDGRNRLVLQTM